PNPLAIYWRGRDCFAEEATMQTIILVLLALVGMSLTSTYADAGSWCANYRRGVSNCGYSAFEQCWATVRGLAGSCAPNPFPGTAYGTSAGSWNTPKTRRASRRDRERNQAPFVVLHHHARFVRRGHLTPQKQETIMRTIILVSLALAATSLTTTVADAGAWCATYRWGGTNCGYSSSDQCWATVRGIGGSCRPNPFPGRAYGTSAGSWNTP